MARCEHGSVLSSSWYVPCLAQQQCVHRQVSRSRAIKDAYAADFAHHNHLMVLRFARRANCVTAPCQVVAAIAWRVCVWDHLPSSPFIQYQLITLMLSLQANLWTESISDEATAEYMLLPRLCAIAECLWSPLEARAWAPFTERAGLMLERCRAAGYHCRSMRRNT